MSHNRDDNSTNNNNSKNGTTPVEQADQGGCEDNVSQMKVGAFFFFLNEQIVYVFCLLEEVEVVIGKMNEMSSLKMKLNDEKIQARQCVINSW